MTLAEKIGIKSPQYVEQKPYACAGDTALHFVRMPSVMAVDQVVGLGVFSGATGVLIATAELPALGDIINGIVRRGKINP